MVLESDPLRLISQTGYSHVSVLFLHVSMQNVFICS